MSDKSALELIKLAFDDFWDKYGKLFGLFMFVALIESTIVAIGNPYLIAIIHFVMVIMSLYIFFWGLKAIKKML